jgi:hypothetical protein
LLDAFDENRDGIIDYEEWGQKGFMYPNQRLGALGRYFRATEYYGFLRGDFLLASRQLKYSNKLWNSDGHDFLKEYRMSCVPLLAYQMSQTGEDKETRLHPGADWGNGRWPSWTVVSDITVIRAIYGSKFPDSVTNKSLYGIVFQYADKKFNHGVYTGDTGVASRADAADRYVRAVNNGAKKLDFVLYVPEGFGEVNGFSVPNVVQATEPEKIFTAHFSASQEAW